MCGGLGLRYTRIDKGGAFGGLGDPEYVKLNPNRPFLPSMTMALSSGS